MYIYVDKIYFITTVWGPLLTRQPLQGLERMQNQAVRLCKHLTKFDHILEHYRQLKWLPLLITYSPLDVLSILLR